MTVLYSVLSFVVAIGILVTVHEFGHYWVARRLGVKVLRFSIGFGRAIWSKRAGPDDTEYVIAAIPLGGYVKMLDEAEGNVAPAERHRAFNRQKLAVRFAIVFAGPLFNFLFAVLAYGAMFMIGVSGMRPLIGDVTPDSLSADAGLRAGQEIVSVEGRPTRTWESVIQAVMGTTLRQGLMQMEVRGEDDVKLSTQLDLSTVVVDELTRGQFFDTLGMEPFSPSVPARIGWIEQGSPAERAGLKEGDLIANADGEPVANWDAWVVYVRERPGTPIGVQVEREGALYDLSLTPDSVADAGQTIGRIGAAVSTSRESFEHLYVTERYGVLASLGRGVVKTWDVSELTVRMLWKMLTFEVSVENLSGPISIAQYAGVSAQIGLSRFLDFLAIVSVSLGILNLLPIPLLDGGHLMYYCVELLRGKPVSEEVQFIGQRLGIAFLVGLMSVAFYNDIARLFG